MNKPGKYQGLPFLATDDKDVYECGSDHPLKNDNAPPPPDSSIEIIPTATLETFQRFQNSFMQSGFSEFDIRPSGESAIARYNRIRNEIEELKSIINDPMNQGERVDIDIDELENNLSNLKLLTIGNSSSRISSKILSTEIDSMIDKQDKPDEANGYVRYELFSKPNHDLVLEASKVNSIEQRIKKLENFLGTEKSGNFLNSNYKEESIMSLIVQLSNKATVLDHSSLDKVDARLNVVLDKLEQISQKKDDLENLTKLNELYEYYVKTVDHNKRLPAILERLQVLNEVQRQASNFSATISEFHQMQKSIQGSLATTRNNLKSLRESLENKSQSVELILKDYDSRIQKIK